MSNLIDGTVTDFDEGGLGSGTVVKIERDEVLLDIAYKSEGVIPSRELSIRKDVNPAEVVSMGEEIEALVLQKEDKEGRLVLSKKRAEYERAWNAVEEKFNSGETVEGEVIEVVKGGLILDIGLRGFLPASLVDLRRVKDLNAYLGTRIEARVIEMDRNRNNVVLSRRVVLEEARQAERQEILSKLQVGMRLKGTVSSIVDFARPSSTSAASTAWSTSPSSPGTTSTTPPRSSRSARRSRSRCSTSTSTASASPSVSSRPPRTPGAPSSRSTRSTPSSRAPSPSSSPLVRSSTSARAWRVSCTLRDGQDPRRPAVPGLRRGVTPSR